MTRALRIAIAEDEPELLADLEETLVDLGHDVVGKASTGEQLVEVCRKFEPDLVIADIKMPGMDGLQAAEVIRREWPTPFVVLSAYHDDDFIQRALQNHVLAYLVKPLNDQSLNASIALAMQRFKEFQALHQQADDLRQALEDRKLIERAKGILMKRTGLSEPDAFRRLQLLSSQKNVKMIEIARTLVAADEAFDV